MPTELLTSARPEVVVGGVVDAELAAATRSVRVHDGLEGPAGLELELEAWGPLDAGGRLGFLPRPGLGAELVVHGGGATLFAGRVTAVELVLGEGAAPALVLLAEDALQPLRMARRTRTWEGASAADVVREVAAGHGLQAEVDLPGPALDVVAQLNRSDLALLHDLVGAAGGELWADGRTLHAAPRGARDGGEARSLRVGAELRELRVRADLAHQVTEVVCCGWDARDKEAIRERAGDEVLAGERAGGRTGAALLAEAFGPRVETIAAEPAHTRPEAEAIAGAAMRRRARRFVRAEGVTTTPVAVGERVRLEGASERFSGEHVVVDVRHRFDAAGGLRTEFTAERAVLGEAA